MVTPSTAVVAVVEHRRRMGSAPEIGGRLPAARPGGSPHSPHAPCRVSSRWSSVKPRSAANLAVALGRWGRVLAVDVDLQDSLGRRVLQRAALPRSRLPAATPRRERRRHRVVARATRASPRPAGTDTMPTHMDDEGRGGGSPHSSRRPGLVGQRVACPLPRRSPDRRGPRRTPGSPRHRRQPPIP